MPLETPSIDVLVCTYNEEAYIQRCLRSLFAQRYPTRPHVFVIDGGSTDRTVDVVRSLQPEYAALTVIADGRRLNLPESLNLGLERSCGHLIAKVDAHGYAERDFLARAVAGLQQHGPAVGCIGGRPLQEGETPFGRALALARSSSFGVGASGYARESRLAEVSTVQCGVYRRRALVDVGGFDPDMQYGEDEELNWRLRRAGWTILLDTQVRFHYVTRPTWRAAFRQYRNYGRARVRVIRKHPRFLRPHHLVPPAFVAGVGGQAALAPFSRKARRRLGATISLYGILTGVAAARAANGDLHLVPRVAGAFPALHLGYGWGMLAGVAATAMRAASFLRR